MKYLITVLCAAALLAGCTKKKSAGLDAPESAVDQAEVEKLKAEIEALKTEVKAPTDLTAVAVLAG